MKKNLLSTALAAAAALVVMVPAAHAYDGIITINGAITAQTCTINGNGIGSKDFTVTLPTVSTSTLNAAGAVAGQTAFNIALTNCTPASGNVHTFFESGPTTDLTTGRLMVTGVNAALVQIELLNGLDASPIKAGFADVNQGSLSVPISAAGTATLPYYARYHALAATTAGPADSQVMYTIAYN